MKTKVWLEYDIEHTDDEELTDVIADITYNLPENVEFTAVVHEKRVEQ